MSLFRLPFQKAQENYSTGNRYARWASMTTPHPDHAKSRLQSPVFKPGVNVSRKVSRTDAIFTVGSCFARNAETALARRGFRVTSRANGENFAGPEAKGTGWANRYNTSSILREFEWASGEREFPTEAIYQTRFWRYVDLHSHQIVPPEPHKVVVERRRRLNKYFARAFSANLVTITLGLTECWFDLRLNDYINFVPNLAAVLKKKKPLLSDPERFEFRVLDFQENMENLERLFAVLKRNNPRCHIVVTVSPIALAGTFTERDVVVANCMSKATLRTCAETWQSLHRGEIDYFPSYEMATMSERSIVMQEDFAHVQRPFVDEIMAHFAASFFEGGDGGEIASPIADDPDTEEAVEAAE